MDQNFIPPRTFNVILGTTCRVNPFNKFGEETCERMGSISHMRSFYALCKEYFQRTWGTYIKMEFTLRTQPQRRRVLLLIYEIRAGSIWKTVEDTGYLKNLLSLNFSEYSFKIKPQIHSFFFSFS